MRLFSGVGRRVMRTTALGVGLISAVTTSQVPEFLQQYGQRLGGALDGLRPIIRSLDEDALRLGLDRDRLIARLRVDTNPLWLHQSEVLSAASERYDRLERSYAGWSRLDALSRLRLFITDRDEELARNAWNDYEPAIPTTSDGLLTAALGFVLGLAGALGLIAGTGRTVRGMRRLSRGAAGRSGSAGGQPAAPSSGR